MKSFKLFCFLACRGADLGVFDSSGGGVFRGDLLEGIFGVKCAGFLGDLVPGDGETPSITCNDPGEGK